MPSRRRRKRAFVLLLTRGGKTLIGLVSVAVLVLTWYGWQFIGDPNAGLATAQVFDDNQLHAVPLDGAVDILLVGMDSRTDAQGNPLPREVLDMLHAGDSDGEKQTDTMILVHIPQDGRRAVAISFPRDSWVELAGGFGKHKLNGAFAYAYNDKFNDALKHGADIAEADRQAKLAGRKNLVATVEAFMGKPGMIDRYAEVNLASFYEVTKALGGVEVCLNGPVKERKSGVDLPAGRQSIEGVQALAFVRQRYDLPNGDLDRIARQQAFLSGLARKVLSRDVLANPTKVSEVITAVKKSVVLSDNWDLVEFAAQMRGLNSGAVEFRTIPVQGNAVIGGADVMRVDPEQVHEFVNQLTADPGAATTTTTPSTSGSAAKTTTPSAPPSSGRSSAPSRSASSSASSSAATTTPTSAAPPAITGGELACVN
nr:LCP family protein [Amycolatopsis acididurans]